MRGPDGTGITSERDLPQRWSEGENIAWRTPIPGLGVSSPIVLGERIFVTSQVGYSPLADGSHPTLVRNGAAGDDARTLGGRRGNALDVPTFVVSAFNRRDGQPVWEYTTRAEGALTPVHRKHNLASASPVTDGERVYAWFGTGQIVALDLNGKLVWSRNLSLDYTEFGIIWGHASSPVLHDDLVILLCDHETEAYVLALDKRTGAERWKIDRGAGLRSYSTPLVVPRPDGDQLLINSSERLESYDAGTGELLWYAGRPNQFPTTIATHHDGVVYTSRGHRSGPYMAIQTDGRGDVSETHMLWRVPTGAPYLSSILYYQGLIYMANGNGIATCVDAETGERVWQERVGGQFSASPVAGDGKVYLVSETGETIVLRAGRRLDVIARNDIGEHTIASPAISNGQIFLRTDEHLVAIGSIGNALRASEKPTDDYVEAMKALAVVAQEMGPANEAADHVSMNELVIRARPALDVLQKYWLDREAENAIGFVRAASKAIAEISVAVHLMTLSANPVAQEGARLSTKNLLATCGACHAVYRERLPDGSYRIK